MSEMKACPFCGAVDPAKRYVSVKCRTCGGQANGLAWNTRPIEDALRAEVAALKATVNRQTAELLADESHCLCRADVYQLEQQIAALKDELKKYTEPLTQEQAQALYEAGDWPISARGWNTIDAAIRRVRRGE